MVNPIVITVGIEIQVLGLSKEHAANPHSWPFRWSQSRRTEAIRSPLGPLHEVLFPQKGTPLRVALAADLQGELLAA